MKTKAAKAAEKAEEAETAKIEVKEPVEEVVSKSEPAEPVVAKEPTPTEVVESLEAEAADSVSAPDISMMYDHQSYLKVRTELPKQYDAKFPERLHIWAPDGMTPAELKGRGFTVVLKDGEPERHGGDILCWMRKDVASAIRRRERERSEQSVAGLYRPGTEANFKRKRTPKSSPGEED
jgi:hypothetical protein